jgi:hypothetical protein
MVQESGEIWTAETLLQPILSKSDRLLVLVSMMQVRHMPMIMLQRQMAMPMGVRPHDFLFVIMLMMWIGVGVDMVVFHACMRVEMAVVFSKKNADTYGHRRPCQILRTPPPFPENGHGSQCPDKRSRREERGFSGCA